MAIVGYARVSTQEDPTAPIETLKAAGADPIYREKISGVRADRPQLARLMEPPAWRHCRRDQAGSARSVDA